MAQAEADLEHARGSIQLEHYDWACFSAQQAAEKAVKAILNRLGAEAWGHSVSGLLHALEATATIPETLTDFAKELDKAYVTSRYPDALPSGSPHTLYTLNEAERMVGHAHEIVEFCKGHLSRIQR